MKKAPLIGAFVFLYVKTDYLYFFTFKNEI